MGDLVKGNGSPAKVESRDNKREKKLSRESLLLPFVLFLLLPPSLLDFSLKVFVILFFLPAFFTLERCSE